MQEYELNILEQYHIEVRSTRKIRGAILCDTDQGVMLLKELNMSPGRIPALCELHDFLKAQGYARIDSLAANRAGDYISISDDGGRYILKHWFQGREADVRKTQEILEAVSNLAKLHNIMEGGLQNDIACAGHLREEYLRHNRELNKVRKFMRRQSPKGEFEAEFLKYFDQMYQWADTALSELDQSDYDRLYKESVESGYMVHGEYNYHNILMTQGRIATTNFDKFKKDIQVSDLYYFLRKIMEKNGWKDRLGDHMLNTYSAIRPLAGADIEYIKLRLVYPEKFWKVADSYYRSNKAWISAKSIEKLNVAIRQTEEKKRFLENIFTFHL